MPGIIDSHVHFWDRGRFDYQWLESEPVELQADYLPSDLYHPLIEGLVVVQADCRDDQALAEAQWFHELDSPVLAVVAQAPLELDCVGHLDALRDLPLVSGVRRLLQGEPLGFALSEEFVAGAQLLQRYDFSLDLCIRSEQLAEVTELVARCPDVRFVLDHLGKPQPVSSAFDGWARDLEALAALPNVWCKLSGLASEAPPDRRSSWALQPWLSHAIEVFGADRCMFGSDWPVVTAVSTYTEWIDIVESALDELPDERAAIFGATARAVYGRGSRAS